MIAPSNQRILRSVTAIEIDEMCRVPRVLRLRTIQVLGLTAAVASLAAALEWPLAWRMIALVALAAASLLLALAAGREWRLMAVHASTCKRAAAFRGRPLLTE